MWGTNVYYYSSQVILDWFYIREAHEIVCFFIKTDKQLLRVLISFFKHLDIG